MPTMMKRTKNDPMLSNATLTQAFSDWNNQDAYVSGNNYRLKSTGKVASWNTQIRQWFYNEDHFHAAAQHYKQHGYPAVPPFLVHENVRITKFHDKMRLEVAVRLDNRHGMPTYDWSFTVHCVYGWAAQAIYNAIKALPEHRDHSVFQNVLVDMEQG
jgi:hypothetical protein